MHTHICRDKDTDSETGRRTHAQAREFEWALRQAPSSKGRTLSPVVIELCVADHAALKSIPSVVAMAGRLVKIVRMSQGRTYHSGSASILAWRERRDRIQIFGIAPDPGFCSGRALRTYILHSDGFPVTGGLASGQTGFAPVTSPEPCMPKCMAGAQCMQPFAAALMQAKLACEQVRMHMP